MANIVIKVIITIIVVSLAEVSTLANCREKRIINIDTIITDSVHEAVCLKLLEFDKIDPNLPIEIIINSAGGSAYAALGILDMIEIISSPIYTECNGMAASAAAIILASGKKGHRIASSNSRIMIHHAYSNDSPDAVELAKVDDELMSLISKYTGKEKKQILTDISTTAGGDLWLSSKEALDYGIIDFLYE